MGGAQQAGGAAQGCAEVVAGTLLGLAGVQGGPDAEGLAFGQGPGFSVKGRLGRKRGPQRLVGLVEGGVEGVPGGLEDVSSVGLDTGAEQGVVSCEGGAHGVGVPLPQAGAALDVGKQERERPDGQVVVMWGGHRGALSRPFKADWRWKRRGDYLFGSGGRPARRMAHSSAQGHSP